MNVNISSDSGFRVLGAAVKLYRNLYWTWCLVGDYERHSANGGRGGGVLKLFYVNSKRRNETV